jgi:hypothetical protein
MISMRAVASALGLLVAFLPATLQAEDEDVSWIADAKGCKIANPFPQPNETVTWSGECKDGLADGEGVLEWYVDGQPRDRYEGTLKQGWAEGKGTLVREGMRYSGDWKRSAQDGEGRYEGADGSWYQGQWKEGQPHGQGEYQGPDGRRISGTWVDGEFQDETEEDYDNPNRT